MPNEVPTEKRLEFEYYITESDNIPVQKFIRSKSLEDRKIIGQAIKEIEIAEKRFNDYLTYC